MKDVIEEQRQALLKGLHPLWNSELEGMRVIAKALDGAVRESFQKIQVEADYVIAHLEGDAGRLEMAAPKLPHVGRLLSGFAKALRYYARRLADSNATKDENPSNLIVLPGADRGVNGT
jgi:hypothetical protein